MCVKASADRRWRVVLLLLLIVALAVNADIDGVNELWTRINASQTQSGTPASSTWDIVVTVYSFDRPRQLLDLLRDLDKEAKRASLSLFVHVIDDNSIDCVYPAQHDNVYDSQDGSTASTAELFLAEGELGHLQSRDDAREGVTPANSSNVLPSCLSAARFGDIYAFTRERGWRVYHARQRHGKRRYWHLVAHAHALLRHVHARYYVFLPDDDRLCQSFFGRAIDAWNSIEDASKVSLMLHIESSREHEAVWTPLKPRREERAADVFRIGWVESGNFLCERRFLEVFDFTFPHIATDRWDGRPTLSSGVGSTLSETLYAEKFAMFRTAHSLVAHVGIHDSKLNANLRASEPLRTLYYADGEEAYDRALQSTPAVAATMASRWTRLRSLQSAVYSLAPQVDHLYVYLNDYDFVPVFLRGLSWLTVARSQDCDGDIGDAGKFYWAHRLSEDVVFTVDDDLIYPADYVTRLMSFLDSYKPPVIVGVHGIILMERKIRPERGRSRGYYASREVLMAFDEISEARSVNILGTGTVAYRRSSLPELSVRDFPKSNMADVFLGRVAKRAAIPMVVMPHPSSWLKEVDGTSELSLYKQYTRRRDADKSLTETVLQDWPWPILDAKLREGLEPGGAIPQWSVASQATSNDGNHAPHDEL